ncbi:MAG: GNAT family N-acetyltransferase [Candidatus Lokiarchaeota archaeon]|nr:GNAT family N-acetyltransferase [Candidatus Lokiarchaeota archaeon]
MKLYFRALTKEDIPAILDISKDIWEGDDYIPDVIERWLNDRSNLAYGTFLDKEMKELIGFGRVKMFSNGVAWLQGGRVKVSHQKKGIGREQLKYAIDYAIKVGARVAQYDTSSRNLGSISLAKFHGFEEKKRTEVLESDFSELKLTEYNISEIREISNEEAKEIYEEMDIGPGDELNIGWSYIPLANLEDKNSLWITNSDAILQKIDIKSIVLPETPRENEVWIVVYGDPEAASQLISYTVDHELNKDEINIVAVYCQTEALESIKEMGFKNPYWEDKNEPIAVVLFEKDLRSKKRE